MLKSSLPSCKSPFPRPSLQGAPAALPYPMRRRLSSPRVAALRRAAGRSGGLPRRAGCAASAVGAAWPPAGGAGGRGRGAPERPAQTCRVHFLSALGGRQPTIIHHDRRAFLPQLPEVCGALPSLGPLGRCCPRPGVHREHPRRPGRARVFMVTIRPCRQPRLARQRAPLLLPGGSGVPARRACPQRLGKTVAPAQIYTRRVFQEPCPPPAPTALRRAVRAPPRPGAPPRCAVDCHHTP